MFSYTYYPELLKSSRGDFLKTPRPPLPVAFEDPVLMTVFPSLNALRIHCLGGRQPGGYLGCDLVMIMAFAFRKLDYLPLFFLTGTTSLMLFNLSLY